MVEFNVLQDEIDFFIPNEELKVKVEQAGDEKIIIIDDFYKHPMQVRELAKHIPATRNPSLMHALPGARVEASYYFGHFGYFLTEIITNIYKEDIDLIDRPLIQDCLNHATFLINVQTSDEVLTSTRVPHIDNTENARYAVGIYLNTPEECAGGTAFYTFKGEKTVDFLSSTDDDLRGYMYNHSYVQEDDEFWKKIYLAEMKFNRLVVYKQNILHTPYVPAEKFTKENPRMIQMFFI